jgi:hypothetical protein
LCNNPLLSAIFIIFKSYYILHNMLELRSHMHRTYLRAVFFFSNNINDPPDKRKMLETRKMTVYAVCVLLSVLLHHRESETAKRIRSLLWYGSESLSFLHIVPNYNRVGIHTHTHTQYIRLLFIHGRKKFDSDMFFVFWDATFGRKKRRVSCVCVQIGEIEREREKKRRKKN